MVTGVKIMSLLMEMKFGTFAEWTVDFMMQKKGIIFGS
jgi:hypothetical protein